MELINHHREQHFFEKYDSDFDTSGTGYQEVNFELGDTINTSVTLEILYHIN